MIKAVHVCDQISRIYPELPQHPWVHDLSSSGFQSVEHWFRIGQFKVGIGDFWGRLGCFYNGSPFKHGKSCQSNRLPAAVFSTRTCL